MQHGHAMTFNLGAGLAVLAAPARGIGPGLVLALASLALAPVAVFAPNGTVVLVCVAGVVLALDPAQRRAALTLLGAVPSLILVGFLVLAAVASLWSFDPLRGLWLALRLAALFAAGLMLVAAAATLSPREARTAHRGMALAGVLLIGLMLIEAASGAALTRFLRGIDERTLTVLTHSAPLSRGGIVLAIFIWPVLTLLPAWYGRLAAPIALPAAALAVWLQPVEATVLAALAGLAVFYGVRFVPAAARRHAAVIVAALLLVPPLAAAVLPAVFSPAELDAMPQSHRHRVEIWTYAVERIAERPVLGWGFDASRELMGTGEGAVRPDAPMSLHTHNAPLQAWMEMGLGGIALMAALGWCLWRRAAAAGAAMPAALAGTGAALVFFEISRGAWQHWWLAVLWLFAAWIAALGRPPED